jgi:hypothetical protein
VRCAWPNLPSPLKSVEFIFDWHTRNKVLGDALDWAASSSSSTDRIDQLAKAFGVNCAPAVAACTPKAFGAGNTKPNEPQEEEASPRLTQTIYQPKTNELEPTHTLHPRLTPYIGVRRLDVSSHLECKLAEGSVAASNPPSIQSLPSAVSPCASLRCLQSLSLDRRTFS